MSHSDEHDAEDAAWAAANPEHGKTFEPYSLEDMVEMDLDPGEWVKWQSETGKLEGKLQSTVLALETVKAELQSLKEEYECMRQGGIQLRAALDARLVEVRRQAIEECAFAFDDRPDIRTVQLRIAALLKKAGPY